MSRQFKRAWKVGQRSTEPYNHTRGMKAWWVWTILVAGPTKIWRSPNPQYLKTIPAVENCIQQQYMLDFYQERRGRLSMPSIGPFPLLIVPPRPDSPLHPWKRFPLQWLLSFYPFFLQLQSFNVLTTFFNPPPALVEWLEVYCHLHHHSSCAFVWI